MNPNSPPPPETPSNPTGTKTKKQLGWDLPNLHIPPPSQEFNQKMNLQINSPYNVQFNPPYGSALSPQFHPQVNPQFNYPYSANINSAMSSVPSDNPYVYPRKASEFMFSQLNGLKDFTKSGMGIGEKTALWLYSKVSKLSRNWFTHIFLSVVIILYTVGGAAIFVAIEGKYCIFLYFF